MTNERHSLLGKRLAMSGLMLLGLLATLSGHDKHTKTSGVVPAASASGKPVASAYITDHSTLLLKTTDGALLDQLNFSFAQIKDGKATGAHWQNIEAFKAYIRQHPHIRPVLSIGGWTADGFSQACSTESGLETLAQSLVALMEKHDFMGVDIDWEYPCSSAAGIASSKSDKENFTLLLKSLRGKLDALTKADGRDRMLSVAVGGDPMMTDFIDCSAVGALVDQVNIMTYDLHAGVGTTTHHTALYSTDGNAFSADRAVKAYGSAGIPARKIMIGSAFYGRGWTGVSAQNNGLGQKVGADSLKSFSYKRIRELIASHASQAYYDENAQAAYLFDGSTFVSYDNEQSLRAKGAYVRQNGLMGLMCWEYGGDVDSTLLTALHDSLYN